MSDRSRARRCAAEVESETINAISYEQGRLNARVDALSPRQTAVIARYTELCRNIDPTVRLEAVPAMRNYYGVRDDIKFISISSSSYSEDRIWKVWKYAYNRLLERIAEKLRS